MRRITASISDELKERLDRYLLETYGVDKLHGKITLVVEKGVDAFLMKEGY